MLLQGMKDRNFSVSLTDSMTFTDRSVSAISTPASHDGHLVECIIIATLTKLRLDPVHHLVVNIGFLVSCVQVMFVGHFDFTTAYHPKGFLEYHQASVLALHDGEHCQHSYACSL